MAAYGYPIAFALFVWWFSTGLIIALDNLPRRTFRWSMAGGTAVLAASLLGLARSSADASVGGAYAAFTCGLLVWGWQEMSFFMGFVTGPRRAPCSEGSAGWRRFGEATGAMLYHELAIVASAVAVVALTWGGANQVGTWTFVILWLMRQSAKLNVFLGVRNLNEEFLPEDLRYLGSFFTRKPMNLLFPMSITVSTIAAALLAYRAYEADSGSFAATGLTFLATMTALGLLEHWLMVLPLPFAALWHWALGARRAFFRLTQFQRRPQKANLNPTRGRVVPHVRQA